MESTHRSEYDVILVGVGAAGAISLSRWALAHPDKSFLALELGGPTAAAVGGSDFPPYYDGAADKKTIFDVPGEYFNIAFQPKGKPYKIAHTAFTYQGKGYGGNSQFNGMLFQVPRPAYLDAWPNGWQAADMRPRYEALLDVIDVSDHPSADGHFYNPGAAEVVGEIYSAAGYPEVDTTWLPSKAPYFSRPYVASADGLRGGPLTGFLEKIVDSGGHSRRDNLTLLRFAEVSKILFADDGSGRATGVTFRQSEGLDKPAGDERTAFLKPGGRVVMAAGALNTPRLLLLSGVGPAGREKEIFPDGPPLSFTIDNPLLGVGLFDHVGTGMVFSYDGPIGYQAYNYADYKKNAADLEDFVHRRSGPYAQYGPVSVMHRHAGPQPPEDDANMEFWINPNGLGTPGGTFYPTNSFAVYAMLLTPEARSLLQIDSSDAVMYPNLYLSNPKDLETMTDGVYDLIQLYQPSKQGPLSILFGPGGPAFPKLDPNNRRDVQTYVQEGPYSAPGGEIYFTKLIMNHWGGTCPLSGQRGGVDPKSLRVDGTENVHVIDASLMPAPVPGHPVATVMAIAEKAGSVIGGLLAD